MIAILLVVIGTTLYPGLGMNSNYAWLATDVVCGVISIILGLPLIGGQGVQRSLGIMLMLGVAGLIMFHVLALPWAGPVRTVHPGWKYLDGFNAALWGIVAVKAII